MSFRDCIRLAEIVYTYMERPYEDLNHDQAK